MSLLSRLFGRLRRPEVDDRPDTLRLIAAELSESPPERARFLAAFAYVLARVAHADMQVDADELRQMERTLVEQGDLSETEARLTARIALDRAGEVGGTDDYRVTRELRRLTEKPARVGLMRCLLALAAADDSITTDESREFTAIGEELGFSRSEISALRYEYRDRLAELQRRLPGEQA